MGAGLTTEQLSTTPVTKSTVHFNTNTYEVPSSSKVQQVRINLKTANPTAIGNSVNNSTNNYHTDVKVYNHIHFKAGKHYVLYIRGRAGVTGHWKQQWCATYYKANDASNPIRLTPMTVNLTPLNQLASWMNQVFPHHALFFLKIDGEFKYHDGQLHWCLQGLPTENENVASAVTNVVGISVTTVPSKINWEGNVCNQIFTPEATALVPTTLHFKNQFAYGQCQKAIWKVDVSKWWARLDVHMQIVEGFSTQLADQFKRFLDMESSPLVTPVASMSPILTMHQDHQTLGTTQEVSTQPLCFVCNEDFDLNQIRLTFKIHSHRSDDSTAYAGFSIEYVPEPDHELTFTVLEYEPSPIPIPSTVPLTPLRVTEQNYRSTDELMFQDAINYPTIM